VVIGVKKNLRIFLMMMKDKINDRRGNPVVMMGEVCWVH
jgi:hypothetical protein